MREGSEQTETLRSRPVTGDSAGSAAAVVGSQSTCRPIGSIAGEAITRTRFIDKDVDSWLSSLADLATSSVGAIHSWIGLATDAGGEHFRRVPSDGLNTAEEPPCACLATPDALVGGGQEDVPRTILARTVQSAFGPNRSFVCQPPTTADPRGHVVVCRAEYLSRIVGTLVSHFPQGDLPTAESVSLLESLAEQAGLLIGTHHLLMHSQERNRELEAINMIAEELSGSEGILTKFDKAMDKVLEVVAADGGLVYLLDRATGDLNVAVRRGVPSYGVSEAERLGPGEGISGWVVSQRKPEILYDVAHHPRLSVHWMAQEGVSCLAVVPIMARGEALGTLCAFTYDDDGMMSEREHLLCAVGHQMGIALENQELVESSHALQRERIDLLRERLVRVTSAHEEERSKLARELHDQVAQGLVSSIVGLRAVSSQVQSESEAVVGQIDAIGDSLSETLQRSREIILDLRSTLGERKPFAEAVCDDLLAKAGNESGALCSFETVNWPAILPPDVGINLYRIIQEALANATRHGHPKHVWLKIRSIGKRALEIVVADDGCGFDPRKLDELRASSGHAGIVGIRERAMLMGGIAEITTSPMSGTTVKVTVPWKWAIIPEDMS